MIKLEHYNFEMFGPSNMPTDTWQWNRTALWEYMRKTRYITTIFSNSMDYI